jgi:hypothetical protein
MRCVSRADSLERDFASNTRYRRPLPVLFQPSTQSVKYSAPSGAKSQSVASKPHTKCADDASLNEAPFFSSANSWIPLERASPRKSHTKKRPSWLGGKPVPGFTVSPDGPFVRFATGGTMYAACPSKCGYQSFSSFHGPRKFGSVIHCQWNRQPLSPPSTT